VPSMHYKHSRKVAGAGSTGGILAVCITKFRKFFKANGLGPFQKTKER
jgi:hypothetical protein